MRTLDSVESAEVDAVLRASALHGDAHAAVQLVGGSLRPCLIVTAYRSRVRTALRYRAALRRLQPVEGDLVDPDEVGESPIALRARAAAIRSASWQMTPGDAELPSLVDLNGVSRAQVAALVGIGAGAARVRSYRARGRLRVDLLRAGPSLFAGEGIR